MTTPLHHEDRRDFNEITARELLATAIQPEILVGVEEFLNEALAHCVSMPPEHDVALRDVATRINSFVESLSKLEVCKCKDSIFVALYSAMIEHINRVNDEGEIRNFLDGKIN